MNKFLITIFVLTYSFLPAQKKNFTIEDVVFNSYYTLAPERIAQLNWIPDSEDYYFIMDEGETFYLVKSNVKSDKVEKIISLESLNKYLQDAGFEGFSRFPRIDWVNHNSFNFWKNDNLFKYDTDDQTLELVNALQKKASNIELAPNKIFAAYTIDNNLYLSINSQNSVKITNDENPGIVNGTTVHRSEFGITKGIFWSPNSNAIAFYHKDETMVTDYPIVDLSTRPAHVANIKYPMAGQKSHHVKVGVYNLNSAKTIWLKTGKPEEQYLTNIAWSPDEQFVFIAVVNRDQNHMALKQYNAETGDFVKTLFEESDEKYVEPENPMIFLPNDPTKFLWKSERDGWDHYYLYNLEGELLKQVTKGQWVVLSFEGFSSSGEEFFITSTKNSPMNRTFYSVNLNNLELKRITKADGINSTKPNFSSNYFINSFQNSETPGVYCILDKQGNQVKKLLVADNPIKDYNIGNIKFLTLKSSDYTDLYCRLITPPDFDSTKTYPVIVYVYGGPHAQLVTNSWVRGRYDFWFQYMAERGFIVFTLDNRGSGNRGKEFEQATFRRLGTHEVEDQLVGVNYLKSLNYVDSTRFGVFGWSYGGFMTTSLMTRTNNAFKVGVGGGAVIDWQYYEVMYTERYMDTPESNPDGYKEASLLNYVDNLKGKLLLVHGTSDPTVVWQNTLLFAQKAANKNIALDYFPYIGHGHGVGGKDALHLYTKISNYFLDNL